MATIEHDGRKFRILSSEEASTEKTIVIQLQGLPIRCEEIFEPEIPVQEQIAHSEESAVQSQELSIQSQENQVLFDEQYFDAICSSLREFQKIVYETAEKNGRYNEKPMFAPLVMHVISELTEAASAYLYNNKSDMQLVDFALQNIDNPMFKDFFRNNLKSKFEDEMADAILVLFSIAGYLKVDIAKHLILKNHYNKLRDEHSVFNQYSNPESK